MTLRLIFKGLVAQHGPSVLSERGRLTGLLLDRGHSRETRLVEAAFDAGVVGALLKRPGWWGRRQALKRLRYICGLHSDAALAVVEAYANVDHVHPGRRRRLRVFAAAIYVALPSLALVLTNSATEGWQSQRLLDFQADIDRLHVELGQRMAEAEAMRNTLQVQIEDAGTAESTITLRPESEPPAEPESTEVESKDDRLPIPLDTAGISGASDDPLVPQDTLRQPDMVAIAGGCFQMGSASAARQWAYAEREKSHRVCVKSFKLGRFEVTQGEWQAVMQANPSRFADCGVDCPVEGVTFAAVHAFVARLNAMTGEQYRLPTEAEWEYACRAGRTDLYCGSSDLASVAWSGGNSGHRTHPVGERQANAWGLYDMTGNVAEWTCSNYAKVYDGRETRCATHAGAWRVRRGGSWRDETGQREEGVQYNPLRSTSRDWSYPETFEFYVGFNDGDLGFRIARD